ncbi:MAG: carboxypeptidase-like regulatory domain-containing protein [Nocardioides sp.]
MPSTSFRVVLLGVLLLGVVALVAGCGDQRGNQRGEHVRGAGERPGDGSGIAGLVVLGPQCPAETEGDLCAEEPAAGAQVTIAKPAPNRSGAPGAVVARTETDSRGTYRTGVAPGDYVVSVAAGMSCESLATRVTAGAYSAVDLLCDTGIR